MKTLRKLLIPVLSVCFVAVCIWTIPSSAAQVNDATVKSYEQQIAELEAKQQEALQKIQETKNDIDNVMDYKKSIDESIEYTTRKISTTQAMIAELENQIEEDNALIAETEAKIAEQKEAFLSRMVALHEDGNASYIELILGAEDLASFLSRVDYVNSIMEYDKQVIAERTEAIKTIEAAKEEIAASIKTQEEAMVSLEAEQTYLEAASNESENAINALLSDEEAYQQQYNSALEAEAALDAELEAYLVELQRQQEQAAANSSESAANVVYANGEYAWPVPASGTYISSSFGNRNLNGSIDYHAATDIAAATGTPIFAANSGTVLRSEWHDSYGNYILIDHGNGNATLYAHMSSRIASAGQTVSKGETIGLVGNTGYSFGSHLHFEFRVNGQRVDATAYVSSPY